MTELQLLPPDDKTYTEWHETRISNSGWERELKFRDSPQFQDKPPRSVATRIGPLFKTPLHRIISESGILLTANQVIGGAMAFWRERQIAHKREEFFSPDTIVINPPAQGKKEEPKLILEIGAGAELRSTLYRKRNLQTLNRTITTARKKWRDVQGVLVLVSTRGVLTEEDRTPAEQYSPLNQFPRVQ